MAGEVERVVGRLTVQPLVIERPRDALADAVLVGRADTGPEPTPSGKRDSPRCVESNLTAGEGISAIGRASRHGHADRLKLRKVAPVGR